jgi:hypothetical protein
MATRVKGQDVAINFTTPQGLQEGLGEILDFEAELDLEILEEEYLGKNSKEYDEIFNGVSGVVQLHVSSDAYFRFSERVQDRAQRRTAAGGIFNVTSSFTLGSGRRVRVIFEDVHFGAMPLKASSRKDYVTGKIQWKGSKIRRVL